MGTEVDNVAAHVSTQPQLSSDAQPISDAVALVLIFLAPVILFLLARHFDRVAKFLFVSTLILIGIAALRAATSFAFDEPEKFKSAALFGALWIIASIYGFIRWISERH